MTLTLTDLFAGAGGSSTGVRIGSLFSGVGGLDLAVEGFFDAETVWHCEFDPNPSKVLAARWPGVPNLGDVTQVDWSTVEPVDIMCGGFPCQDLSLAGRRGGMRPGTRSGLWADYRRAINVLNPKVVVIENVRGFLSGCAESDSDLEPCPGCLGISKQHRPLVRALGRVLIDLAALGFDAEWVSFPASDVGAPHGRFRVFVVAYAQGVRFERGGAHGMGGLDLRTAVAPDARRVHAGRDAGACEAAGGGASAVDRGRGGTPVTLLPTPATQPDTGNGHARNLGGEVKLLPTPQAHDKQGAKTPEQVDAMRSRGFGVRNLNEVATNELRLLPTPSASNSNDGEGTETWLARRERVKETANNGNGMGMPLAIAVQLLPTPVTTDHKGSRNSTAHRTKRGAHSGDTLTDALLPTPRASRGASATETMYALGGERDNDGDPQGNVTGATAWGEYEPAVRQWEALTRPAPSPTRPDGRDGNHRLSPLLPEWMMGYPAGWVTDILDRNPAIKACGNGVVPQQAYRALELLWPRVLDTLAVAA